MSTDLFSFPRVEAPDTSFDVDAYLQRRGLISDFVMVEFGHGAWPVAYQQDFSFKSDDYINRRYYGVEGWLRDPFGGARQSIDEAQEKHKDHHPNVFFINQDLGGVVQGRTIDDPHSSWYEGGYTTETVLADNVANEVLLSNVVGDLLTSYNYEHLKDLLSEVARVLDYSGIIVIRETITPEHSILLCDDLLDLVGLKPKAIIKSDSSSWTSLEDRYKGDKDMVNSNDSYYLMLAKSAVSQVLELAA